MHVLSCQGVNDAYVQGLRYLRQVGIEQDSRAGRVLVAPTPVTTVYSKPCERVLFDAQRDANPAFHLMESLWLLFGRNDAVWLDRFVSDFSKRFAEDDGRIHDAYGFRWRKHFDLEWGGHDVLPDQLDTLVGAFKRNPNDRRTVLTMWDPMADLGRTELKTVPCNTHAYLRIRQEGGKSYLDLTVCCRSNDFCWGLAGSNAVQFSILLEYLAGRIGVGVGKYYQISNNLHVYTDVLAKVGDPAPAIAAYPGVQPMGNDWEHWDEDLKKFMVWVDVSNPTALMRSYRNRWFEETAEPLFRAHALWKDGLRRQAVRTLVEADTMAPDWRQAAYDWFDRRLAKLKTA